MNVAKINNSLDEKKETKENNNIKFNNSIEFIDESEKKNFKSKFILKNHLSKINNYKNAESKELIKVINSIPTTSLSSLIFKKGLIITAIAVKLNSIYIGTNKGEIRAYSWKTEKKLNFYISQEISKEYKKDVICMDVSDDNRVLVVGYLNGYIILWDVVTSDYKKIITDEFSTQISAIKFTLIDKSFYEFLASDIKGEVKRISVSEGFFYNSVNSSQVIEYNKSINIIEILKLTEEQKKLVIKYNKRDDQEELLIVAFGSYDTVFVVQIEPEIKKLYNFNKPEYIPYSFHPDICFGIGKIPAPFVYDGEFSEEINKNINIKKDLNIQISTELNLNKEYQLIYVSWGKILHIFLLFFDLNDFLSINHIGYYINKEPIIRMGFLSNNIIYILDIYKKLKIINTAFVNSGEIKVDSERNIINKNSFKSELCPEFNLDYTILFQSYLSEINSDSIYKSSYKNLVISQDKSLFVACKRYIYLGVLLNWEQCINELFKNSKKLEAFKLCIDIYHGKNKVLDGIPIKVVERKNSVKRVLKGLILQLILNTINVKGIFFNEEKSDEILSKCLNMAVELCLDVSEINFLFKEILPILEEKGYFDFFMEKIKPFILNNKITSAQLGESITLKIMKYYMKKNDYFAMSGIIININDNKIDIKEIKDMCWEKNLFIPLIYIYFKYYEKNLFNLVLKIYDLFDKANEYNKSYDDYKNDIIYNNEENKDEILTNKIYLGQKSLWFINLCLKGKKYPKEEEMINKNIHEALVQNIFLWLINDEILTTLLKFDSYTFFILFSKFYTEKILLKIIKKISKENIFNSEMNLDLENFDINKPNEIIINKVNSMKNILINDDLNEYIIKINSLEQISSIENIINSISYILNFNNFKEERIFADDYFEYHTKILTEEKIEEFSLLINSVISNYKEKIGKEILKKLLNLSEKNDFPLVTIQIYQILNENIKCLDIFITNEKVRNKKDKIFPFINEFMSKSEKNNIPKYKNELINRMDNLFDIDIEESLKISLKWLKDEQLNVIDKIPLTGGKKLLYVEQYLSHYNSSSYVNEDNNKGKNLNDKYYNKILNLHIEILCLLDKKESILKLIQNDSSYISDECLKICLRYKASEAAIYIYIKKEECIKAINLCKMEFTKVFDNLIQIYLNKNSDNKNNIIRKHDELINQIYFICEKESQQKIWFDIFEFLFNKITIIKSQEEKNNINLNEIKSKISDDINNLILRMHSYVDIKLLLEKFYNKPHINEFKSLTKILCNFIKEQKISQKIYNNVVSLLDYNYYKNFKLKKKHINQGFHFQINECDFCHKTFQENNTFILFKCGHVTHKIEECVIQIEKNIFECLICCKEKQKYMKVNDNKNSKIIPCENNKIININNNVNTDINNEKEKEKNNKLKEIYNKMDYIERNFRNRKSLMDIDIEEIKKNKMKK